jgi:hypothetical protein
MFYNVQMAADKGVRHSRIPLCPLRPSLIGEYARGDTTTNTVEGFFGLFKRGVNGSFHHISEKQRTAIRTSFRFGGLAMASASAVRN